MFGLEGTGFTISVAVTLLLAGLVAFYCKQRMDEMDKKFEGLLNLNKALANSQAVIEQRMMDKAWAGGNTVSPGNQEVSDSSNEELKVSSESDDRTVVSDGDSSEDSDSESDSESESGSESETDDHEKINELENPSPVIIGSEIDNVNSSDGIKVVELLNDSENKNLEELKVEVEVEVEALETTSDIEELEESSDSEESIESADEEGENNEWIKKIVTQEVKEEVDFKKLNVNALRELVLTKNLADKNNVKKLKKKDLLELLS